MCEEVLLRDHARRGKGVLPLEFITTRECAPPLRGNALRVVKNQREAWKRFFVSLSMFFRRKSYASAH